MYSYGPPHMDEQKQDGQLEHTYISSVRIQDVALRTCQKRWTIGKSGERGPGISMLAAQHDDDIQGKIDKMHRIARRGYEVIEMKWLISKYSKPEQKEYKIRHEWEGKVIHNELCKKLKFDYTTKWYVYKPESILKDEMWKILWDFEIQTDRLIPVRRLDLVIINIKREPAK